LTAGERTLPNSGSLDALLGDEERNATFHDAVITGVQIDYVGKRFVGEMQLCVGDPDASDVGDRERRRRGQLIVEGLRVWALEPPGESASGLGDGLWVSADGMLEQAPTDVGKTLAQGLGSGHVGWFLFFNNLNAFGYLAGDRAEFRWS
jgi:hypothetical protein